MKLLVFILLFSFGCSTQNRTTRLTSHQSSATEAANLSAREALVEKKKAELTKSEIDLSVSGENKDVMIFRTKKLSFEEIRNLIKNDLQSFSDFGFSEILIIDESGKTEYIKLQNI